MSMRLSGASAGDSGSRSKRSTNVQNSSLAIDPLVDKLDFSAIKQCVDFEDVALLDLIGPSDLRWNSQVKRIRTLTSSGSHGLKASHASATTVCT